MTEHIFNGLTRCPYESWEKCKAENLGLDIKKATMDNRCIWLSTEEDNHCTNPDIQKMVLEKHKKDKLS